MSETGESSIQKRPFIDDTEVSAETPLSRKKTNKGQGGGPKFDEVWDYFIKGHEVNVGHYKATCHYCKKEWARGKPAALKSHLANECSPCPEDISEYWRDKLTENKTNYTRHSSQNFSKQAPPKQAKITQHFGSGAPLPSQVNDRIDRSLLKAWVMAGIPFKVIENPFIVDLLKDLNPGYVPPSRTTLSDRLLNDEITRVNQKIESELKVADGLTLSKNLYIFSIICIDFLKNIDNY